MLDGASEPTEDSRERRQPLFSAVWYGKDRLESAQETIASLQAQSCSDFELVVEDCGSTDGTLELFKQAAVTDRRIRIFQRWTSDAEDVLLSGLRRCRGEFVVVCPGEGRFTATAFERMTRKFVEHPGIGAIGSSGCMIDGEGKTLDKFDIVSLFFTAYRPFISAVFFRREALQAAGLLNDDWFLQSLPLHLCSRVATIQGLAFCSDEMVTAKDRLRQSCGLPRDVSGEIDNRLRLVDQVFSSDGFFAGAWGALGQESKANQLSILWQEFRALGQTDVEYKVVPLLAAIASALNAQLRVDHRTLRNLHRLFCVRSHNLGLLSRPLQKILAANADKEGRLPIHIGYAIWNLPVWGHWLTRKVILLTLPTSHFHPAAPSWQTMFADLYALAAQRYEARGQIDLAIAMWDLAHPPRDLTRDSLACEAMLKSPSATDRTLAIRQKTWVRHHIGERPHVTMARQAHSRIRLAYHCNFMHGDTMRNMMRNVIANHDRSKFEVYGYSPLEPADDIKSAFDHWRHTSSVVSHPEPCTDEQFVDLVRADEIDVFVECTGFSPGHRFRAMSLRCAPVQVSYLNFTGTSQVPNVDYILSDSICTPPGENSQQHYSEKIYRLPGSFFCFDYSTFEEPPIVDPPHLKNGYITFACFGSGGKIGREQIEIWSRLLHRVPNSILRIQNGQLVLRGDRRFMTDRFRAFGIPPDRLIIEPGVDRPTLLKVYSQVDISLDTWPYCGGNTIAESFWHGVPVVTYRGKRFSSAYGASLVTASGCSDLVATTPDQYVSLAAGLATSSDRLVYLRHNLRRMSYEHGLGDSKRFARKIEAAFIDMLEQ